MLPTLKPQSKWSWEIAAYLFLAGLGAGAYVTGSVAGFFAEEGWLGISKIGVSLGFPCVLAGCGFLLRDLGSPKNFWRAAMCPGTSWIARGTIIITIFMIVSAIHTAYWVWPYGSLAESVRLRSVVSVIGIIFGFGTMIYTGILLAAARPIAFWSTPLLPLLFLISALSTGIMAIVLVASFAGTSFAGPIHCLAQSDMVLIVLELFVLGFYLQGTHRVPEARESVHSVVRGAAAPLFWRGVVILGLLVPLALEFMSTQAIEGGWSVAVGFLAAACGITGGLCLRQVILSAGIHAPLRAGRFEIGLPIV